MNSPVRLHKAETLARLPHEWGESLLPTIQEQVRASGRTLVVLDDDPTGTQTVHDVPVLTSWEVDALARELESDAPCFYVLTNSRSVGLEDAKRINAEIGMNLRAASAQSGREFAVVSRSDSTLRGHFPGEVEALARALGTRFDGWLIVPFFLEGGRYTIDDVHYVAEGDALTPAGETEFARDRVFGYDASNLREWVQEKANGKIRANDVESVSLSDLREGGPARVTAKLLSLGDGQVCIVNAASMRDLEVLVAGLLEAEARGKRFLYRTAASFVQARIGQDARPLLTRENLDAKRRFGSAGALIVVGSYVPKTTGQVNALLELPDPARIEINAEALLDERRANEIARVVREADDAIRANYDVVIYTSRRLLTGADAAQSLAIGKSISAGLVEIVRGIPTRPRYVLAKGGITSSDVATQGLEVKRALVRGQILPGVPVWELGGESRFPGLTYIVFPGNVGGVTALVEIVNELKGN